MSIQLCPCLEQLNILFYMFIHRCIGGIYRTLKNTSALPDTSFHLNTLKHRIRHRSWRDMLWCVKTFKQYFLHVQMFCPYLTHQMSIQFCLCLEHLNITEHTWCPPWYVQTFKHYTIHFRTQELEGDARTFKHFKLHVQTPDVLLYASMFRTIKH